MSTMLLRLPVPGSLIGAGLLAVLMGVRPLTADQIVTARENLQHVRVVDFRDGRLQYRSGNGEDGACDVAEVERLLIQDGPEHRDLNEAEEYLAKGMPEEAVVRYERALRLARDYWPAVIRCRLLRAAQRMDDAERTVNEFVALLDMTSMGPEAAARLLPLRLIPKDAEEGRRCLEKLSIADHQAGQEEIREVLRLLRFVVLDSAQDATADAAALQIVEMLLGDSLSLIPVYNVKAAAFTRLQSAGRSDAVMAHVDRALEDCPREMLPEFLMVKGDALLNNDPDRRKLLNAASTYMHIPIHFADHPLAGKALRHTAAIHVRLERPQQAITLLRECLSKSGLSEADRAAAQSELDRLMLSVKG